MCYSEGSKVLFQCFITTEKGLLPAVDAVGLTEPLRFTFHTWDGDQAPQSSGAEPPTWLDACLAARNRGEKNQTAKSAKQRVANMARLSEHGIRLSSVGIFFIFSCIRHVFASVTDVLPCELFGRLSLKKNATFVFVFSTPCPQDESFLPEQQLYQSYMAL